MHHSNVHNISHQTHSLYACVKGNKTHVESLLILFIFKENVLIFEEQN